jgi:hypothetical protein
LELLNEINGTVEQNQWICFLKTAVLFAETVKLTTQEQQIAGKGFAMPVALQVNFINSTFASTMYLRFSDLRFTIYLRFSYLAILRLRLRKQIAP